ncbi:histidine kinase [Microbacterium sp. M28]|uniref:sensor histidine kinase n=1 Tax=Microbacterium sp. M28 TaxID=2962064 RepID=UPI0021F40B1C|nr:histidine kinase [Microbacterium sp. M28]UYO98799.1 histidine kinase [Microbacterium sp. M28]
MADQRSREGAPRVWQRLDVITTAVLAAILLPATIAALAQPPGLTGLLLGTAIALFTVLHVLSFVGIRHPLAAFVVASALMLALALIPVGGVNSAAMYPSAIVYLLVLGQVSLQCDRRYSAAALAVGIVGAIIVVLATPGLDNPLWQLGGFIGLAAAVAAAWALGALQRLRRARSEDELRTRTERAVSEERERINRDLHDLVAHATTVMIAQAEVARAFLREEPETSERALGVVVDTGREALRGMRGIVADDAGRDPAPDLDAVRALVESVRSPRAVANLEEHGMVGALEPVVVLALHHVVREALTNALRHTRPPVRVTVVLDWRATTLVATIRDDGGAGRRASDLGVGVGLVGLAERVRLAGGALSAGAEAEGWAVRAELPRADQAASTGEDRP